MYQPSLRGFLAARDFSGEDAFDDFPVDVGEAEVATTVSVGEFFVIEAHEVEHGGVEVVDVDFVFNGGKAEVVGCSVHVTTFHAAPCHPGGEAVVVVIAAIDLAGVGAFFGHFNDGRPAKFSAPEDEGFVEESALFEIGEEGGDGLITFPREVAMVLLKVVVIIPRLSGAMPDLHEADATLDEATGDKHLAALQVVAIHVADVLRLEGDVESVGRFELHTVGEFEALEASFELGIVVAGLGVFFVEVAEKVELLALTTPGDVLGLHVLDELAGIGRFGVDVGSLIGGGEEAGLPILGPGNGIASGAHRDEAGEVLVLGAEAVGDPGTDAGTR